MAIIPNKDIISSPLYSIICGSVAGVTSITIFHPIDVLRTKIQLKESNWSTTHSLRNLYAGFTYPLLAQSIYKSLIFTTNSLCHRYLFTSPPSSFSVFSSGLIAGVVNSFVVAPVEFLRTQAISPYTSSLKISNNINDTKTRVIYARLWRCLLPTILRDGGGMGLYFYTFKKMKYTLSSYYSTSNDNVLVKIAAGSLSGIAYWAWALPLDTVKANMEHTVHQYYDKHYLTHFYTVLNIRIKQYGILSLYQAWPVALIRGMPSAAVTLTVYDICMSCCMHL